MMEKRKKWFALPVICLAMILLPLFSVQVRAEVHSGNCGKSTNEGGEASVTWEYDDGNGGDG